MGSHEERKAKTSGRTILVNDEEPVRESLKCLPREGSTVTTGLRLSKALNTLSQQPPISSRHRPDSQFRLLPSNQGVVG